MTEMRNFILTACLAAFPLLWASVYAQSPTPAAERLAGIVQRTELATTSLLQGMPFANIGPTVMSGRVTDLAVNPTNPTEFYVAYASSGLWYTNNNGTSFTPLFQEEGVMTLGALAVHWPSKTIYLGSGEVNSSRSSYAGNGVYKSTDGGKSWQHLGLDETHHIGRILVAEEDPNLVWVAALGHLYSTNPERGVFKSNDGGKSWEKTLFINSQTGVVDLVRDPQKPNELFAASWERSRKAWDFQEAGVGSGIWHSQDAGNSWQKISAATTGFPDGAGAGRIGLAIAYTAENKRCLYASLDNYNHRPKEEPKSPAPEAETLEATDVSSLSAEALAAKKDYVLSDFLRQNGFPRSLTVKKLREQLRSGELNPQQLLNYLADANQQLFNTPVIGLEIYRLLEGDSRFEKTHQGYLENVTYSYGYYFGYLAVNPQNANQLYTMGVPLLRSDDGGKNWVNVNGENAHVDHHYLWVNPKNPAHLINGNDGGLNMSYDYGGHWTKLNTPAVSQFYAVAVDTHPKGYRVYGGMQDNGVWYGPHTYQHATDWQMEGRYPYQEIMGGDGMQVAIDTRDNNTVYTGYQFGNYFRIHLENGDRSYITPKHELGQAPYRWNWQTPIHLSTHHQDILYMGSNFVHRSLDQGEKWTTISPDLTLGSRPGDVPYGTLTCLHESPLRFGLLYVGSDDGLVHLSRDGGYSWQNISKGLPTNRWVSRIQASAHQESRVYLSLNGYRSDDFSSYLYVSEDYGANWVAMGTDLPAEPVNVIKEDPTNPQLFYVGTDHGLYISLDRGQHFQLANQLPRVAVHDLVVHPTESHLIVGTHGRSIFRADVKALQALDQDLETLVLVKPSAIRASSRWGADSWFPRNKKAASMELQVYSPQAGQASLKVVHTDGSIVAQRKVDLAKGLQFISYDLLVDAAAVAPLEKALRAKQKAAERPLQLKAADDGKVYIPSGSYQIKLQVGKLEQTVDLNIQ